VSKRSELALDENTIPDFRGVERFEHIQERFIRTARSIMFEHHLQYGSSRFDITALELYLKLHQQRQIWWDAATDEGEDADEQFCRGTWYINKRKGPAYCRIDITAGCHSSGIQAGILIRQLNRRGGSGSALQAIIRGSFDRHRWNSEEHDHVREIHGKKIDGADGSPLRLVRRSAHVDGAIYMGARINIPKRHLERNYEGILMREAPLRIATWRMKPLDEEQ
jgi:hypothetical protein